jgi:hypothetical protein
LTSLVFLTVAALFTVITAVSVMALIILLLMTAGKHWSVIYQAFFSFIHLGNTTSEDAFYADLAQPSELAKLTLFFVAVLLGDSLIVRTFYEFRSLSELIVLTLRHIASG